jgi:hypothetical protein
VVTGFSKASRRWKDGRRERKEEGTEETREEGEDG